VLLRVFVGGALHPEVLGRGDDELVALAHRDTAAWLGLERPPELARVYRHAEGIPQLVVGSEAGSAALLAGLAEVAGLAVAGSALGLYGIADCVASGRRAAATVLRSLDDTAR
jgi:oxygen-dependent protoporphyrinogen oxidase